MKAPKSSWALFGAAAIAVWGGSALAGAAPIAPAAYPGIAHYDFDGDLNSATGGLPLETGAAAPAASPGITYTSVTIGGQPAQAAAFTRGTFFRMTHGLGANGGGSFLNQYTLIMDVMFPSRPTGWAVLWQTNPGNSNDGDWFINASGGLGISG
nr:hypothetical protein [Verrucomicrobiota bacterium]